MQRRARIALPVAVLSLLIVAVTFIAVPSGTYAWFEALTAVSFVLIGGLLGNRRPENPVGWLFLGFGAVGAANFAAEQYAKYTLVIDPGAWPGGDLAASFAAHGWHPAFGLFVFAFLLFPDGRLPSPRWRWFARFTLFVYAGLALSGPFEYELLHDDLPAAAPLVKSEVGNAIFNTLLVTNLLILLVAGASLLVRFRRARGAERQQVKWFILPVAAIMVVFPVSVVVAGDGRYGVWLFPLVPASAAVAILRYRLYDIDLIIKRTLVYAALTATLAAAYLAAVLLLQLALDPLTSSSGLAVAGSTLAVAALFQPARARIQSVVDRRFFRARYDAAVTLEAFGARLRDEVDLSALSTELQTVVSSTMQPAHVSLWLRS